MKRIVWMIYFLLFISCTNNPVQVEVDNEQTVQIFKGVLGSGVYIDSTSTWILSYDIREENGIDVFVKSNDTLYAGDDWFEPMSWFVRFSEIYNGGAVKAKGYIGIRNEGRIDKNSNYMVIVNKE